MNKIPVAEGDTLEDIAIEYYGKPDVFKLLEDNPDFNINSELVAGDIINIDDTKVYNAYIIENKIVRQSDKDVITSDTVVVEGQNIEDLAIQLYGSLSAVFELCKDNGINSLSSPLPAGKKIVVDINKVVNKEVLLFYKRNGITVNTGNATTNGGVGFMGIELTFKVS